MEIFVPQQGEGHQKLCPVGVTSGRAIKPGALFDRKVLGVEAQDGTNHRNVGARSGFPSGGQRVRPRRWTDIHNPKKASELPER